MSDALSVPTHENLTPSPEDSTIHFLLGRMSERLAAIHEDLARQREDTRREIDAIKFRVTDLERSADRVDGAIRLTRAMGIPVAMLVLKELVGNAIPSFLALVAMLNSKLGAMAPDMPTLLSLVTQRGAN